MQNRQKNIIVLQILCKTRQSITNENEQHAFTLTRLHGIESASVQTTNIVYIENRNLAIHGLYLICYDTC